MDRGLKRTFFDFVRHPWLHAVSIATITAALVLFGFFLLCYRNFEYLAERTNPQISGTVYLKDGSSDNLIAELREKILSTEGVERATFKPRQTVMRDLHAFVGGSETENNSSDDIFPDVIEIDLSKETKTDAIVVLRSVLAQFEAVAEVDFSEDWLIQYRKIRQFIRTSGLIMMFGIFLGCSFIIANFMGMRHQSRKSEMDIVRLVGAPPGFILSPLIWEGVIEGLMGAALALILLFTTHSLLTATLRTSWVALLGTDRLMYLSLPQLLGTVFVGIAMAFIGSITVFLRFRDTELR